MADPQSTRAIVRRYLEAFNASDFDAMDGLLAEDVVRDINQGERVVGREAFKRVAMDVARRYDENASDIVVMTDESGRRAAVEFTLRGVYRETVEAMPEAANQSFSIPAGLFLEVDDGAITRVTAYSNLSEWKRQVGG